MCSLDRSSEPWHWLSLWSRRVRLSFLLCHEKEAASAVRGQGGYTHHHPGWPAVGPGGHTCPGHSQSQCAARCSCKRHTGWPVVATVCLSKPLLLSSHPAVLPHLSPGPTPSTSRPYSHPVSFSSSSLCRHQDDLLKAQEPLRLFTAWQGNVQTPSLGCQASTASSQSPFTVSHITSQDFSLPTALRHLPLYKQSTHSRPRVSAWAAPSAWNSHLLLNNPNYCLLSIYCMLCPLYMYLSLNSQTNHMKKLLSLSRFTNNENTAQRIKWHAPSHTPHNEQQRKDLNPGSLTPLRVLPVARTCATHYPSPTDSPAPVPGPRRPRPPPRPPAHDVPQLLQVGGCEVPVVAVTPLYVLLDAVQVHRVQVQELWLRAPRRGGKEQSHPSSSQGRKEQSHPSSSEGRKEQSHPSSSQGRKEQSHPSSSEGRERTVPPQLLRGALFHRVSLFPPPPSPLLPSLRKLPLSGPVRCLSLFFVDVVSWEGLFHFVWWKFSLLFSHNAMRYIELLSSFYIRRK